MIMKRIDILDDDSPKSEAAILIVSQADDGDIYISVVPGENSNCVRIRTLSGGGSHPELIKAFVQLIELAEISDDTDYLHRFSA